MSPGATPTADVPGRGPVGPVALVDDPRGAGVRIWLRRSRRANAAFGYVLAIAVWSGVGLLVVFGRPQTLGSANLRETLPWLLGGWIVLEVVAAVLAWRLFRRARRQDYLHLTPRALCTATLRIPWTEVEQFPVRALGRPDATPGIGVLVRDLENVAGFGRARVALANWRHRPLRLADLDQLPVDPQRVLDGLTALMEQPHAREALAGPEGLALFDPR